MRTLATNENNDIYRGHDGNLVLFDGLKAVIQTCEHVARTRLNELPYAQSRGVPFIDVALGVTPDVSLYDMYLRKVYITVPGVQGIGAINFWLDGDQMKYTAEIKTVYGVEGASGSL